MSERFIDLIAKEREAQDKKWGAENHAPVFWLCILGEELGEVCKDVIDFVDYEHELVQVAAVCQAMYESGIRNNHIGINSGRKPKQS